MRTADATRDARELTCTLTSADGTDPPYTRDSGLTTALKSHACTYRAPYGLLVCRSSIDVAAEHAPTQKHSQGPADHRLPE
jgi:hypothetical protein